MTARDRFIRRTVPSPFLRAGHAIPGLSRASSFRIPWMACQAPVAAQAITPIGASSRRPFEQIKPSLTLHTPPNRITKSIGLSAGIAGIRKGIEMLSGNEGSRPRWLTAKRMVAQAHMLPLIGTPDKPSAPIRR